MSYHRTTTHALPHQRERRIYALQRNGSQLQRLVRVLPELSVEEGEDGVPHGDADLLHQHSV